MYNRYTPQPDGTYRRVREEAPGRPVRPPQPREEPHTAPPEPHSMPAPSEKHHAAPPQRPSAPALPGFLQNLIPAGIDTEDLLIILLILLTAGRDEEARNSAMLTIALYFAL